MNNEFEQGKIEFEQKNYEKALSHFENVDVDDGEFGVVMALKIRCLIRLERYREALAVIDPLIENYPYQEILWFEKAFCHIFLNEPKKADLAMETLERIVDSGDKDKLVYMARLYNMMNEDSKAIEYCDKALAIDENYRDALYQKTLALVNSDDSKQIADVSDKLIEVSDKSLIDLMPPFLMRLFSKDYRGSLEVLDYCMENVDGETLEMLKSVVYSHLCEDLNAQILMSQNAEISIDEALGIMFDFKEKDKDFGEIRGVQYYVV